MPTKFCDGVTRRDLLRIGVAGLPGLTLSGYLRHAAASEKKATADSVLFVNLAGGPAHLDTLDMKPKAPVETQGEFKPIQSKIPGLTVCEHLPKFSQINDQFTLIRGIGHTSGSHPLGQSYISTGNRPTPALIHPCLGSVIGRELPGRPDMPPFVAIPKTEWNSGFMGVAYAPLNTSGVPTPGKPFQVRGISLSEGLTIETVNRRQQLLKEVDQSFREFDTNSQLLEGLDQFATQAHGMITSKRSRLAFDVSQESESIQKLFSPDDFSQSLLLATRLIENGVRFVTVTFQGWDTHLDNFKGHKKLLDKFDVGVPALISAMQSKGLLDRTLVVIMGEFGRTPKINKNRGRDHYPRVNWSLMTGGGIQPGQLIGGTNDPGTAPDDSTNIKPDDLVASVYHSLGIDPLKEYHTSSGRPVMLAPNGRVMNELFS